ncbi:thioesterase II family protein [Streptomyces sp. NBC_01207]|uniref:thioesterase II family protein n=1 Tax=Streptomyces sp. NBC_01207 TaxID=2903772 RepID=UPI002E111D12|nr:alpha/beta fold hydrolase [Streptomyces sp. NBC_01207]
MVGAPVEGLPLLCLPHAGGAATAYRTWPHALTPYARAVPVQLPGREDRFGEPLVRSAAVLAAQLADAVAAHPVTRDGCALFGHSMGGLLAFELAHELIARGRPPVHVFVSAYRAPQLPRRTRDVHLLDDAGLCGFLAELEGTQPELLEHPGLLEVLLPVIRADFELCETYRYQLRSRLDVPVTVLGGRHDAGVPPEDLHAWADVSGERFAVELFDGGHFYLRERQAAVLSVVAAALRADGARDRPRTAAPHPSRA